MCFDLSVNRLECLQNSKLKNSWKIIIMSEWSRFHNVFTGKYTAIHFFWQSNCDMTCMCWLWLQNSSPVSKALLSNLGGSSFFLTLVLGLVSFGAVFTGSCTFNFTGGGWNLTQIFISVFTTVKKNGDVLLQACDKQ